MLNCLKYAMVLIGKAAGCARWLQKVWCGAVAAGVRVSKLLALGAVCFVAAACGEEDAQSSRNEWEANPICEEPLIVELAPGEVFRFPRKNISTFAENGTEERRIKRDCSVSRVQAKRVTYAEKKKQFPHLLSIGAPNEAHARRMISTNQDSGSQGVAMQAIGEGVFKVVEDGFREIEKSCKFVAPDSYHTPLGNPLVVSCGSCRDEWDEAIVYRCDVSYFLSERLRLQYHFRPNSVPVSRWISMDQSVREFVNNSRVAADNIK